MVVVSVALACGLLTWAVPWEKTGSSVRAVLSRRNFFRRPNEKAQMRAWPLALSVVSNSLRSGVSLDAALDDMRRYAPSELRKTFDNLWPDGFDWLPTERKISVLLGHRPELLLARAGLTMALHSGGAAPALIESVARHMQNQRALAERIETLTAESRTTAKIVAASPLLLLLALKILAPEFVAPLIQTKTGHWLLGLVAMLLSAGIYSVHRMVGEDGW